MSTENEKQNNNNSQTESVSFRKAKRRVNFTQVGNDMLNDQKISLQAKGLLGIFVSNSEEWKIQMSEIITRSKNGREAHYSALNELIQFGYVARVRIKNKQGVHLKMEYIFSDVKEEVENELQEMRKWAKENEFILTIEYCVVKEKRKKKKAVAQNKEQHESSSKEPENENDIPLIEQQPLVNNEFYNVAIDYFKTNGLQDSMIEKIINLLIENNISEFTYSDLEAQYQHCIRNRENIFDFPVYFVNGLRDKTAMTLAERKTKENEELVAKKRKDQVSGILYNWLEEE